MVGLLAITVATALRLVGPTPDEAIRWALSGFSHSTVWLIFVAFMFGLGYEKTGLGRRIALGLVRSLGRRTLGLGYAVALADLVLAPFTPSNTARSGGMVYPIIKSIPALYDSAPGPTARRVGAYLMWTAFAVTGVTSSMFLTANAANLFAVSLMRETAGINVGWVEWFTGFLPVGVVLFLSLPVLVYLVYPPGLTISREVPVWARRELERMGPMSRREVPHGRDRGPGPRALDLRRPVAQPHHRGARRLLSHDAGGRAVLAGRPRRTATPGGCSSGSPRW